MTDRHGFLVQIVLDPYSTLILDENRQEVNSSAQYSAARRLIEGIKEGSGDISIPLTIVVRKKSLLYGFQDILAWPPHLVKYRDASPRPSVQEVLVAPLSEEITNERLLDWGIQSPSDLRTGTLESHELDEGWLIDCALEKVTGCQVFSRSRMETGEEWVIEWFDYLLRGSTERLCTDKYLMQVVQERVRRWSQAHLDSVPEPLTGLLGAAMSNGTGKQVMTQLLARSLVRTYGGGYVKLLVRNLPEEFVGSWIKEELSAEARLVIQRVSARFYAEGRLDKLVRELDRLIKQEVDAAGAEPDLDDYIEHMSGFFPSEYRNVVRQFASALVDDFVNGRFDPKAYHISLGLVADKFSPLLETRSILAGNHQDWLADLIALARQVQELRLMNQAELNQWWRTCVSLMRCEHLLRRLKEKRPPHLAEAIMPLEEEFVGLDRVLNNEYGDWLLTEFPEHIADPSRAKLVTQATQLATQIGEVPETTILIVVDGMRWDWWQRLARDLGENGYQVESGDSVGLAMLPTLTSTSRRAVLGRFPLLDLIDFVDDLYGVDVDSDEEALLAARVLGYGDRLKDIESTTNSKVVHLPHQYVYVNGTTDDIKDALGLPARHYVVVYSGLDRAAHLESEEQVLEKTVSTSLHLLVRSVADEIDRNRHLDPSALKLIVTADHGCAYTGRSEQISLPGALRPYTEPELLIERHGRVARVAVPADAPDIETAEQQVKAFYTDHQDSWHIIWGDQASIYGLPQRDRNGAHTVAWLSPRDLNYLRRGTGLYVHGGFSLYETIVPLAVLRYGPTRVTAPIVVLQGLDSLKKGQTCEVSIRVGNDNDQELTGSVSIPELRVHGFEFQSVPPGGDTLTELTVNPPRSGGVTLTVVLRYKVGPLEETEWKKRYHVDIELSRRERLEKETKRELF